MTKDEHIARIAQVVPAYPSAQDIVPLLHLAYEAGHIEGEHSGFTRGYDSALMSYDHVTEKIFGTVLK